MTIKDYLMYSEGTYPHYALQSVYDNSLSEQQKTSECDAMIIAALKIVDFFSKTKHTDQFYAMRDAMYDELYEAKQDRYDAMVEELWSHENYMQYIA